jgi:mycothiol synthase
MTIDQDQLIIRPFAPDRDIPQVISLRATLGPDFQFGFSSNERGFRTQVNVPGFDSVRDRWVVVAPGDPPSVIASAFIRVPPGPNTASFNIIVHPHWRRRGVGSSLLSKVSERAHQLGSIAIQFPVNSMNPAATGFLHKHGFIPQGAYTELRLPHGVHLPPVIWPYGYTVRPYAEVGEISLLTEVMNLAYIPLWGHRQVSEEEMLSWLTELNPEGIFLVFSEKGRVVGISRTKPSPDRTSKNGLPTGYIDAPGVVPQHRRLDLYRALVLAGINWLRNQGMSVVEMESWGDKLEVLKMYRELGFEDICQEVHYRYDFTRGDQAG